MKQRFSAFTLIEVIIALTLFSFVIIGVVLAVTHAYRYVENSKMQVMAVNLAREGVEMMYTIRDTNRRKSSGNKDTMRLRLDPFGGADTILTKGTGYYALNIQLTGQSQYPMLTKVGAATDALYQDISHYTDGIGEEFKVVFTGGYYSGGIPVLTAEELMSRSAEFYRVVYVDGVYNKSSGQSSDSRCSPCGDGVPQELRFCVKVFAVSTHVTQSEICSMMTNFRK